MKIQDGGLSCLVKFLKSGEKFGPTNFKLQGYVTKTNPYLTDYGDAEEADGVHVESDGDAVEGHGRVRNGGEGAGPRKVGGHVTPALGTLLGTILQHLRRRWGFEKILVWQVPSRFNAFSPVAKRRCGPSRW